MKYKVDFEYSIPEFTSIELDAGGETAAHDLAFDIFNKEYPEAIDPSVVKVTCIGE